MIDAKTVGANVERLRGLMSREELAGKMTTRGFRWSRATVFNIEQGTRELKTSEAYSMLAILGYDPIWDAGLLFGVERGERKRYVFGVQAEYADGVLVVSLPPLNADRMRDALYETWKYYDEAGESGEDYVLSSDNLKAFAADLCREYETLPDATVRRENAPVED